MAAWIREAGVEARGTKILFGGVIVMTVALFIGTGALFGALVYRALDTHATTQDLQVMQPAGTRIVAVTRQSDNALAITLRGGGSSDRLLIWDLGGRRITAKLHLTP